MNTGVIIVVMKEDLKAKKIPNIVQILLSIHELKISIGIIPAPDHLIGAWILK
jgi:hypothetical protein